MKKTDIIQQAWSEKNKEYHNRIAEEYEVSIRPPDFPSFLYKFKYHLEQVWQLPKDSKILDLGTGSGDFCLDLLSEGFTDITAFDISDEMLKVAKQRCPSIKTQQGDMTNLPFENESFDFINIKGALHHVYDYEKAVSEISRCLKPGGYFRLQEPIEHEDERNQEEEKLKGMIEAQIPLDTIKKVLADNQLNIVHERLFLHFPTNRWLSEYTNDNDIKNKIVDILDPIFNELGLGDIFLLIAQKENA